MEVEEVSTHLADKSLVMASASNPGSITIHLHPLVVMNISEHWTRVRAQGTLDGPVIGALIGKQISRKVEVMNSFELVYSTNEDGSIAISCDYYFTKEEQYKQVFKDLEFLGWYSTGGPPNESDLKIHHQICCAITESPIMLKLNPVASTTDLPIAIYESVIDVGQEAQMKFVQLTYTLATDEAERIGVDHVARVSSVESGSVNSTAANHLEVQHNSITMLYTRIRFLLKYIKAVQEKKLPHDHEISREVSALCCRLPVLDPALLSKDLYDQYNDVALMTYLGVMSKGCHTINQCISKFNVLNDRQGAGRRIRGLFS